MADAIDDALASYLTDKYAQVIQIVKIILIIELIIPV